MTVYATCNFGRAKRVSSVTSTMVEIRNRLAKFDSAVLFCQEIDEGDKTKPADHALLRSIFSSWTRAHMARHDPILSRGVKQRRRRWFRASPGVKHQGPARQVNESRIRTAKGEPDVVLLGGHYHAGVHNGDRPAKIKAELEAGYDRMLAIHRERILEHHAASRHVIWGMDTNWRDFPRLHRSEVSVAHHGPDYLRAIPAPGYAVLVTERGELHNDIESMHACLFAVIEFTKETP